jgi:hypothetical protein
MEKFKILLVALFISFSAIGQQYTPMTAAGYQMKRIKADSTLHIPSFCGVPTLLNSTAKQGALAIDTCGGYLYMWTNANGWDTVNVSGGGGGNQDFQSVLDNGNFAYNKDINLYGKTSGNQIYLSGMDNNYMPFMALGDSIGGGLYSYTYPQATIEFQNKYQSQKLKQQDSIRATIYLPTQNIDATDTLATLANVRNQDLQSVTDLGNTTTNNIELINSGILLDNYSRLQKGTINAGYGGNNGIAQICGLGYELKWEGGRLFIMGSSGNTIREARYMFTDIPQDTNDITEGYYIDSRWILDNGDVYVCTDNTTDNAVWELQTISGTDTTSLSNRIDAKLNTVDTTNAFLISVSQPNDSTLTFVKGTTSTNYVIRASTSGSATRLVTSVYNNTGSTIAKGSVVYISGRHSSNLPTIALAEANNEANSYKTFAVVENDIPTSNSGIAIQAGNISNLNLPISSYTDGDIVYLSPTVPGGITTTKPLAPNHICKIGSITRAHPTFGAIEIKIENGWQLDELSDVKIAAVPNDSTLLQFSRVDSLWHDVSVTNAIGNKYLKPSDTSSLSNRINVKLNASDTSSLSNRINTKVNLSDSTIYQTKFRSDSARTNVYTSLASKIGTSDTSVFQRKSIAAYSFQANNTASAANSSATTFKDIASQTLSGGITWTGTAPSGTTNHQYRWNQVGNLVTLYVTLVYGTAGANNTQVTITFPSDLPTPFSPTGLTAANDVLYSGSAIVTTQTNTIITTARTCMIRRNTANNGFELIATTVTGAQRFVSITIQYYTN